MKLSPPLRRSPELSNNSHAESASVINPTLHRALDRLSFDRFGLPAQIRNPGHQRPIVAGASLLRSRWLVDEEQYVTVCPICGYGILAVSHAYHPIRNRKLAASQSCHCLAAECNRARVAEQIASAMRQLPLAQMLGDQPIARPSILPTPHLTEAETALRLLRYAGIAIYDDAPLTLILDQVA